MSIPDQNLGKRLSENADQPVNFQESSATLNELYETDSYHPVVKEAEAPDED